MAAEVALKLVAVAGLWSSGSGVCQVKLSPFDVTLVTITHTSPAKPDVTLVLHDQLSSSGVLGWHAVVIE